LAALATIDKTQLSNRVLISKFCKIDVFKYLILWPTSNDFLERLSEI